MAQGSQHFLLIFLAIFVVPRLMQFVPNFDPLVMIICVMGSVALLQHLGLAGTAGAAEDDEGDAPPPRGSRRRQEERNEQSRDETPEELLAEAERCLEQNSYSKAQEITRKVTDNDPENAKAWEILATALKWEGKRKEAAAVVKKAREVYEVSSPALAKLEKELSENSSSSSSKMAIAKENEAKGEAFVAKRQYDLAAECFAKAFEACDENAEGPAAEQKLRILRRSAECSQQLQDWGACRRAASAVLEADPNDMTALMQRAVSNEALEKFSAALEDARKLMSLDPKNKAANRIAHSCQQALR
eukprot:TRINITY_DN43044_c0_g1_i1.p1 TRINITY_DN43044_c0_g1~~TRINITY_DN43044_c0_g1_i1.p1  ORF type:complete len:303 (+),score=82.70 TRINITY_DN43044_c0_g1_i1:73-981(+)